MKPATYWKLFGSPEFQFSKVSGFPVDIQKNLQNIGLQQYEDDDDDDVDIQKNRPQHHEASGYDGVDDDSESESEWLPS